jgi:hypothetical protein
VVPTKIVIGPEAIYCEANVSDIAGDSAFRNPRVEWPAGHIANEPHLYCAYNESREQILCTQVDLADLLPENLRERLALLTLGSGKALWLAPFRGIAPSHVDSPIDLLFLNCDHLVLAMAESFPIAQPTTCNWPVGTALALPVQSIALSGTLPGDQIVLCSPEELKRRFVILRGFCTGTGMGVGDQEAQNLPSAPHSVAHHSLPVHNRAVQLTTGEEILEKHARPFAPPAVPGQTPARSREDGTSARSNGRASSPMNWLRLLLPPEPPPDKVPTDKRKFPREILPGVAAYFFNGGPPSPSSVRDISMSGMFVVTSERWYLGTIIRFTLTDGRVQPPEQYVTINAEAVRWGDDGVGLRFLFQKPRRGEHNRAVPLFVGVTPRQLHEFLQCFRPGTSPQNLRN